MTEKSKYKIKVIFIFKIPILFAIFLLFLNFSYLFEENFQHPTYRYKKINLNKNEFDSMDIYALHSTPLFLEKDFPFHIMIKYDITKYINKYIDVKNFDNYESKDKDTLKSFVDNIDSNLILYWELWTDNKLISNSYSYNKTRDVLLECDLYDKNSKQWRPLQDSDYTLKYYYNKEFPINKNYNYKLKYKVKYNSHIFDTNNIYIGYVYDRMELTGIASSEMSELISKVIGNFIGAFVLLITTLFSYLKYTRFKKKV